MIKKFSMFVTLFVLLVSAFSLTAQAADVPVTIEDVWFDNVLVDSGEVRGDILRGDTVKVQVKLEATDDDDNIRLEVEIEGDDRNDIRERTEAFEVKAGQTYVKTLHLDLPDNMDQDQYTLHIEASNRKDTRVTRDITLDVNTKRHDLQVEDVIFSQGQTVEAGRSLLASVRVSNEGEKDQGNVKVTLTLEGVGADADYIDEIEEDEEKTSEQLYVRVPTCTAEGEYTARITVDYDDRTRVATQEFPIQILASDRCEQSNNEGRTVITVGPENQNVVAGGNEAIYPIALTNAGTDSRTYTVQLSTGDWATARLSSNVLVVGGGETKVAYAYVAAKNNAAAGDKLVSVSVASGDQTLKEVTLKANVVTPQKQPAYGTSSSLRQGLQVGLVGLVVLLVIVGLIVGFSRLKNDDNKDDETYY